MRVRFIRPVDGYDMRKEGWVVPDSHGRHYIAGKMAINKEDDEDDDEVESVIKRPSSVVKDPIAPIIRRSDVTPEGPTETEEQAEDEAEAEDEEDEGDDDGDVKRGPVEKTIPERQPEGVEIVEGKDGLKSPKRTHETAKTKADKTTSQSTAKTTNKAKAAIAKGKKS